MRWKAQKQIDSRLGRVPALARTTVAERVALARHGTEIDVGPGATLVSRGQMANQIILVLGGSARCLGRTFGCRFGPGAVVGDTSASDATPQAMTVTTVEPTRLLVQTHQEFADLEADAPRLADELRVRMGLGRLATVAGLTPNRTVAELFSGQLEAAGAVAGVVSLR